MEKWVRPFLVALLLMISLPMKAWANVEDYETALMTPEQLYQYEYEPVILEEEEFTVRAPAAEVEEATTLDSIVQVAERAQRVNYNNTTVSLISATRQVFTSAQSGTGYQTTALVITAAGMCFLWWGVRKAVRIVMASARKGKASL